MIRLIRKDGVEILLNTDAIQSANDKDGTVITMVDGEKLEVKNTLYDVAQKTKAFVKGIKQERKDYDKSLKEKDGDRSEKGEKSDKSDKGDKRKKNDRYRR